MIARVRINGFRNIADSAIRGQMDRALAHWAGIAEGSPIWKGIRDPDSAAAVAVDEWLAHAGRLALRLDDFQAEFHLQSEARSRLRDRIRDFERRISESRDEATIAQLRETLAGRRRQLRAIEELGSLVGRGLLRLEHAVTALGTIRGRLAVLVACEDEGGEADRFIADNDTEIRQIDAVLVDLDRTYAEREVRMANLWDNPTGGRKPMREASGFN
jgi:hypothetical protein